MVHLLLQGDTIQSMQELNLWHDTRWSIQKLNLVSVGLSVIGCRKAYNKRDPISAYIPCTFTTRFPHDTTVLRLSSQK